MSQICRQQTYIPHLASASRVWLYFSPQQWNTLAYGHPILKFILFFNHLISPKDEIKRKRRKNSDDVLFTIPAIPGTGTLLVCGPGRLLYSKNYSLCYYIIVVNELELVSSFFLPCFESYLFNNFDWHCYWCFLCWIPWINLR